MHKAFLFREVELKPQVDTATLCALPRELRRAAVGFERIHERGAGSRGDKGDDSDLVPL